jgi:hypothetical protein
VTRFACEGGGVREELALSEAFERAGEFDLIHSFVGERAHPRLVSTDYFASIENLSARGCRLVMRGKRLPALAPGDRLRLRLAGSARGEGRSVSLELETRWVRPGRGKKVKHLTLGASFVGLSAGARTRLSSLLKLRDFRPTIQLQPLGRTAGRRRG